MEMQKELLQLGFYLLSDKGYKQIYKFPGLCFCVELFTNEECSIKAKLIYMVAPAETVATLYSEQSILPETKEHLRLCEKLMHIHHSALASLKSKGYGLAHLDAG